MTIDTRRNLNVDGCVAPLLHLTARSALRRLVSCGGSGFGVLSHASPRLVRAWLARTNLADRQSLAEIAPSKRLIRQKDENYGVTILFVTTDSARNQISYVRHRRKFLVSVLEGRLFLKLLFSKDTANMADWNQIKPR